MSVKPAASSKGDTKRRILQVATELMQARGFHGFTYHDIAGRLGISHVAVHHHYRNKATLVEATVRAYTEDFREQIEGIAAAGAEAAQQLRGYAELFARVLEDDDRICLCGALAAELNTLPESVRAAVVEFYSVNEAWLAKVVARHLGKRTSSARVQQLARSYLSLLEGAMISARAFGDASRLSSAAQLWVDALPSE